MEEKTVEKKYSGYGYHGGGRKPTGVKRVSFQVSCTPEQRAEILAAAKASGMKISEYVLSKTMGQVQK